MPFARPALASLPQARRLEFDHLHTGETISVVFAVGEHYVPDALNTLNYFLRDHYSGEVGTIDPQLFDLLFQTRQELACEQPFEVISGYRCAATNSKPVSYTHLDVYKRQAPGRPADARPGLRR